MTMTNRERVEGMLKHERIDRVPIYPFGGSFAMRYSGLTLAELFNNAALSFRSQMRAAKDFDWVFVPDLAYAAFGGWEFGGEIKWPETEFDQAPTVTRHPANTVEDVMKLEIPDIPNAGIIPLQKKFFDISLQKKDENKPWDVVAQLEGTFTLASNIVGAELFTKWVIKEPDIVHSLMQLAVGFEIEMAKYWKRSYGTKGVLMWGGEPVASNQVISPKTFEKFVLPYRKALHEKVLGMGFETIFMHICGDQNGNLPFWAQIPMGSPGILSFGHEVDLTNAAEYFPDDIIVGNLDPSIIQIGTPEEVYDASRLVIEKGKKIPAGFMFGPGCELPPMAPVENVRAMTTAVDDFGIYV